MHSFASMIEHEIPRMRQHARILIKDHADSEELVHDAIVRAMSRAHLWHQGSNLRTWLFTILYHEHINNLRRSSRKGVLVPLDKAIGIGQPPSQLATIELGELRRALHGLTDKQRSVLVLITLDGMNYAQVAGRCRIPVGTVRSRLSRARQQLRSMIEWDETGHQPERTVFGRRSGAAPQGANRAKRGRARAAEFSVQADEALSDPPSESVSKSQGRSSALMPAR